MVADRCGDHELEDVSAWWQGEEAGANGCCVDAEEWLACDEGFPQIGLGHQIA